ncbi:TIGR04086 family membrane protein [Phosphitispora fastidiosa]|uniref:TIGR04086 family membrane protein n=1 Tax=Phosphitispora fastidiosa TaxID=2837202 RepID=UPI001E3EEBA1|nr:putative membrane protein (TIGR04086 family) [Phosphitispora fastidiosa]
MNLRSFLEALSAGGKTVFIGTILGLAALIVYVALAGSEVVYLWPWLITVALISIFLGGLSGGMAGGTLGWLHGAVVAAFYLAVITVLKAVMFPTAEFGASALVLSAGILFAGAFGGVTGINLRPLRRRRIRRRYLRG